MACILLYRQGDSVTAGLLLSLVRRNGNIIRRNSMGLIKRWFLFHFGMALIGLSIFSFQARADVDVLGAGGIAYYIANTGSDGNDGLSEERAWQTINHVNLQTFRPGDSILFKCGDTWRETLRISWSGEEGYPISIASYGEGNKPAILGSTRISSWVREPLRTRVWRSVGTTAIPMSPGYGSHPASIFFGETDGTMTWGTMQSISSTNDGGTDFSALTREYDWCWENDHIYIYSETDPNQKYQFVEVPQRDAGIFMASHSPKEYIVIDGLELMYTIKAGYDDGWPMDYEVRGLTIKNCHIGYVGVKGAASAMGLQIWHSDMIVRNNDIHDCGRRNISYNVYVDNGRSRHDLVFEDVVFENNILHSGFHTTGFDISGGSSYNGVYFNDTFRNFVFRNNLIYDDPGDDPTNTPNDWTSMGIYLNSEASVFTDFKVYNNIVSYPKQKGLIVNGVDNAQIYNNTFYGMNDRAGGSGYRSMVSIGGACGNFKFINNIVHGTVERSNYLCRNLLISGNDVDVAGMDHNLYYQEDFSQRLTDNPAGSYDIDEWAGYLADTGWEQHSPTPSNPLFVDPENRNFHLLSGSPAIGSGTPIPWITTDHEGVFYNSAAPSIGAYEFMGNQARKIGINSVLVLLLGN